MEVNIICKYFKPRLLNKCADTANWLPRNFNNEREKGSNSLSTHHHQEIQNITNAGGNMICVNKPGKFA
jgi:hypothetical protein